MATAVSTGYGPRNRLYFDGDDEKYELWEIKFLSYLRLQNLHKALEAPDPNADGDNGEDEDKNKKIFAELVQYLDDKSLSLIIREAKDDGRAAIEILREHYTGKSKPRIIALYTELTTLKKGDDETVTAYLIRAEKSSSSLTNAGESISDSLLVAMALKGLPPSYSAFATVVTQKDTDMKFAEFKTALKSYEETEKFRNEGSSKRDNVMMNNDGNMNLKCYNCGKTGHKKFQCKAMSKGNAEGNYRNKWCSICRNKSHNTQDCRKNNSSKFISVDTQNNSSNNFVMKTVVSKTVDHSDSRDNGSLLVDCGATSHIIVNKNNFINFDANFEPAKH